MGLPSHEAVWFVAWVAALAAGAVAVYAVGAHRLSRRRKLAPAARLAGLTAGVGLVLLAVGVLVDVAR